MQVDRIIREKGTEVATIRDDAPLSAAVAEMARWNVGALIVFGRHGPVVGVISERDVVRGLGAHGLDVLERPVSSWMTAEVVTCGRESTVEELMRLMTQRRIRHVPVLEGGALVGIVSIGDVVKFRLDELETETRALADYLTAGR